MSSPSSSKFPHRAIQSFLTRSVSLYYRLRLHTPPSSQHLPRSLIPSPFHNQSKPRAQAVSDKPPDITDLRCAHHCFQKWRRAVFDQKSHPFFARAQKIHKRLGFTRAMVWFTTRKLLRRRGPNELVCDESPTCMKRRYLGTQRALY